MITEIIRNLYDYNAWANARILDTAARLTREQLLAPGKEGVAAVGHQPKRHRSSLWFPGSEA